MSDKPRIRSIAAVVSYPTRYFVQMVESVTRLMHIPAKAVIEAMAVNQLTDQPCPTIDDVTWAFNTWKPKRVK